MASGCALPDFSLREVPHEVTGVSLYMCVYVFTPKGPLSILRENSACETKLPPNFGESATQYMQELKENLEVVANYADVSVYWKLVIEVNIKLPV